MVQKMTENAREPLYKECASDLMLFISCEAIIIPEN